MKKLIIMGLTVFAFGLVGCGKSEEEKCDENSAKEWKDGECVDKEGEATIEFFIITNKLTAAVTLESGDKSLELAQNACAKVEKVQFDNLKVSAASVVCDNADTANKCPGADHYEVIEKAGAAAGELKKVDKLADDSSCKELANKVDPEYTLTNLLGETVKVSVGTLSVTLTVAATAGTAAAPDGLGCVKVKKSQLATLKIETDLSSTPIIVCDNADSANKCVEDNLQVKEVSSVKKAVAATAANATCSAVLGN